MSLIPCEWTLSALSVELGIGQRTLARRLVGLAPDRVEGRRRFWRLARVLAHLAAGDGGAELLDPQQERARLDRARREIVELDAAQRRGELVTLDDFTAALVLVSTNARDRLLAMPSRLASTCADLPAPELFTEAQRLVYECLDAIRADVLVAGEKYDWSTPRWTARGDGDTPEPATPGAHDGRERTYGGRRRREPAAADTTRRGDNLGGAGLMVPGPHTPEATEATADRPGGRAGKPDGTPPRQ